jgi:hypothetical protein
MSTFQEFQRELVKRGIDDKNAYMFTLLYERLIETERLVMLNAQTLSQVVDSLQGIVGLHEEFKQRVDRLARGMTHDGVDVMSVAREPSKDN